MRGSDPMRSTSCGYAEFSGFSHLLHFNKPVTFRKIQHTIVTTVGETAEKFNLDHHHYIEPLSKTETMHASTMNHTRSCNRDVSPDPLLE